MAYELTLDDLKSSLQQSGVPEQEIMAATATSPSFWKRAGQAGMKGVESFNKAVEASGLPAAGAHILSMPMHIAANIGDLPGQISNYAFGTNIPRVSVPEEIDPVTYTKKAGLEETPMQRAAGTGGDLLSALLTGGATFKGASTALGLGEAAPIAQRIALGTSLGAAESPREVRGIGAGIGGAIPGAAALTKTSIGKGAASLLERGKQKYGKLYDSIFDEAQAIAPDAKLRVPQSLKDASEEVEQIYKAAPGKRHASIKRFKNNPTLENAHDAQSDLGKIQRDLQDALKKRNLTSTEINAMQNAADLQKRIRGAMQNHFVDIGKPELAQQYGAATRGYADEVAPLNISEVRKLLGDNPTQKELKRAANALLENKKFNKSDLSQLLPGFKTRKMIKDIPSGVKAGAGLAAIPLLYSTGVPGVSMLRKLLENIGN